MQSIPSYSDRGQAPVFISDPTRQAKEPAVHQFTLEAILADIERQGQLTAVTRALLTLKMQEVSKNTD